MLTECEEHSFPRAPEGGHVQCVHADMIISLDRSLAESKLEG